MTTLKTVTDCTFLVLSREQYRRWIWDDKNALQLEVGSMGKYLLEQNRVGRVFLFLQGMDRILYMFVLEYESHKNRKSMVINASRQEIAERSGLSIKTVNRAVTDQDHYHQVFKLIYKDLKRAFLFALFEHIFSCFQTYFFRLLCTQSLF